MTAIVPFSPLLLLTAFQEVQDASAPHPAPALVQEAWIDIDTDGRRDLILTVPGFGVRVLRHGEDGSFENVTEGFGHGVLAQARKVAWDDADGDDDLDLIAVLGDGTLALLRNEGEARFTRIDAGSGLDLVEHALSASWTDVDGDGAPDLFVRTATGFRIERNAGAERFECLLEEAAPLAVSNQVEPVIDVPADTADGASPPSSADGAMASVTSSSGSVALEASNGPESGRNSIGTGGRTSAGPTVPGHPATGAPVDEATLACFHAIADATSGLCIEADTVPTLGRLYPLSEELNVDPATGRVGLGTTTPEADLQVVGDPAQGTEFISPDIDGANGNSSLVLAEGKDGAFGMELFYDGTGNELVFIGRDLDTSPRMRVTRDATPSVEVFGELQADDLVADDLVATRVEATASVRLPDGTAGAPGLRFTADPNTGLFQPLSNSIAVTTGGSERLRVNSLGRVGIGTISPSHTLDVVGSAELTGDLEVSGNFDVVGTVEVTGAVDAYGPDNRFRSHNPNNVAANASLSWLDDVARIRVGGSGTGSDNGLDIQTLGNASLLRIQGDGKVGLSTDSPEVQLHVPNGTDVQLSGGGYLQLGSQGGDNLAIDENEIMARSGGTTTDLNLNLEGGPIRMGGDLTLLGETPKVIFNESDNDSASLFYDGDGLSGTANRVHLRTELSGIEKNVMTWELGGDVGIGTSTPIGRMHIVGGNSVVATGGGFLRIGATDDANMALDENEIQAFFDGSADDLTLNVRGGDVRIGPDPGGIGKLQVSGEACKTGGTGFWATCSDRRIKQGIRELEDAVSWIEKLNLVAYRMTPEFLEKHPEVADIEYYNVIAQEFEQIAPDYVKPGSSGVLHVDTYPALIHGLKAIQELVEDKRQLAQRNRELEQRLANLEALLGVPSAGK